MNKPILLTLSAREFGSNVLEAAARLGVLRRIVIAGRDGAKAQARATRSLIGTGLNGHSARYAQIGQGLGLWLR